MNYIEDILVEGISRDIATTILKSDNNVDLMRERIRRILDTCTLRREIHQGSYVRVNEETLTLVVQFIPRLHNEWFNLKFTYGFSQEVVESPSPVVVKISTDECASSEDAYDRAMETL